MNLEFIARYAGINASDKENNKKLIENLNKLNIEKHQLFLHSLYSDCLSK